MTEDIIEISPACFSEETQKICRSQFEYRLVDNEGYKHPKINRSWRTVNTVKVIVFRRNVKRAIQCLNSSCSLYRLFVRPPVKDKKKERGRPKCGEIMIWTSCQVKVDFVCSFEWSDCTMGYVLDTAKGIIHNHGSYAQRHLTQEELGKVDAMVRKNQEKNITCFAASKVINNLTSLQENNPLFHAITPKKKEPFWGGIWN